MAVTKPRAEVDPSPRASARMPVPPAPGVVLLPREIVAAVLDLTNLALEKLVHGVSNGETDGERREETHEDRLFFIVMSLRAVAATLEDALSTSTSTSTTTTTTTGADVFVAPAVATPSRGG